MKDKIVLDNAAVLGALIHRILNYDNYWLLAATIVFSSSNMAKPKKPVV